jgi:hypothetical protein
MTLCEGQEPATLAFAIAQTPWVGGALGNFTPPSATITVPDVSDGAYAIVFGCAAGWGTLPFAVRSTPQFTG